MAGDELGSKLPSSLPSLDSIGDGSVLSSDGEDVDADLIIDDDDEVS